MQLSIQVSPFFPPTLKSLTICTHPEWQAWRASRPPPPGIRSNYRPTGLLSHCRLPAFADITFLLRLTTCTTLSADALHNEETMRVTTLPQLSIINFPPPFGTRSNIPPTPLHLFEYNRSSPSSSLFVRRRIKADEIAYYSRLNCENETLFISEKYEEFISFALESVCIYIYKTLWKTSVYLYKYFLDSRTLPKFVGCLLDRREYYLGIWKVYLTFYYTQKSRILRYICFFYFSSSYRMYRKKIVIFIFRNFLSSSCKNI